MHTVAPLLLTLLIPATWATEGPPALTFTDVTSGSGLEALVNTNSADSSAHGGGIAVLDFDQDGWFDLFLAHKSGGNLLLRNNGDMTFSDVTEGSGTDAPDQHWIGAIAGDVDGDGWPDLLLLGNEGNRLLTNQGDGTFEGARDTGLERPGWPTHHAAFGDIDQDGDLDIYVGNHTRYMDLFSNGPPDPTAFTEDTCVGNSLYIQDTPGHWVDKGKPLGVDNDGCTLSVAMTDLDGDGWLDLYSDNDWGSHVEPDGLYWNNGLGEDGQLAPFSRDAQVRPTITGMGIAVADFDRDMDLDFFLSNTTNNKLFENLGGRMFVEIAKVNMAEPNFEPKVSWGVAFEDFDLDTWPDIWAVNTQYQNSFYWNNGDKTFSFEEGVIPTEGEGTSAQFGLAWADFDNDGDVDIITGGISGETEDTENKREGPSFFLYRNDQATGNHWLQLELVGTTLHPMAIGARIEVKTGEVLQLNEVTGGTSYASGGWEVQTIGLGSATKIDRLTITWPGGAVEILHDLAVDQRLRLVEGELTDTGVADTAIPHGDSADDTGQPPADSGGRQPRCGEGCASSPAPGSAWLLLAGLAALGRRRR
jgi:MYXO-CTERM domain-containing protein